MKGKFRRRVFAHQGISRRSRVQGTLRQQPLMTSHLPVCSSPKTYREARRLHERASNIGRLTAYLGSSYSVLHARNLISCHSK